MIRNSIPTLLLSYSTPTIIIIIIMYISRTLIYHFKLLIYYIHEKRYIATSANSEVQSEFTYDTARDFLSSLEHPPGLYRDDDNVGFYNNHCGGYWTQYMIMYVYYISLWMQRACFWSDTVMTDRLFSGGGTFQSDHIVSMSNDNTLVVGNKLFEYNLKNTKVYQVMTFLKEGEDCYQSLLLSCNFVERSV